MPIKIKEARINKGYSQDEVAKMLGISRTSFLALEQGKGELSLKQANTLANILGLEVADFLSSQSFNLQKYKEVLMTFLKYGEVTKTKLAKLIYLADFAWYYTELSSMTGASYKKYSYGPVPDIYFRILDEMYEEGVVNLNNKNEAILVSLAKAGEKQKPETLSKKEQVLIGKIHSKWKNKRTSEIVAFTHSQLPWKIARDSERVHYELITQEDPDHVY